MRAGFEKIAIHGTAGEPGPWNSRLGKDQYAVFFYDARTDVMIDEAGSILQPDGGVAVFDSLGRAREFSREIVTARPMSRAEINNASAAVVETIHSASMERQFDPRRLATRDLQIGIPMLLGAVGTAIYAAMGNWQSIWAYIIGTKLLIIGCFII